MPNHVHGIIVINKTDDGHYNGGNGDGGDDDGGNVVETQNFASLRQNRQQSRYKNKFGINYPGI